MAEVWSAHDRVSRALLGPWRGREIDRTDGMLLLFDNCTDAVGYALEYHRVLATLPTPLAARVGLHFGSVILRENARGRRLGQVDRRQGDGIGTWWPDAPVGCRPRNARHG